LKKRSKPAQIPEEVTMKKKELYELLAKKIMLLDGATGTELQKRGMPKGVCPEKWALEHPGILEKIQRAYIDAGSDVIYTCTFGCNPVKLAEYGLEKETYELNRRLAELSRKASEGTGCLVAGDIAPTGRFIKPLGDLDFEDCVNVYKEQVRGLLDGGVDLFIIETMIDIQEARAALLAVRESCELPVMVSMSFEAGQRTLMGTDPVTALITLQSLGADVVGCNCSLGPEQMVEIIKRMKPYAKIPLLVKPNAGLPRFRDGKTVFDMMPDEFARFAGPLVKAGANLLGGCCGTSPEYIAGLYEKTEGLTPVPPECRPFSAVTSARETVFIDMDGPLVLVGERINPTGKKKLQESLRNGNYETALELASEQTENGAAILDVNVGMPGIDERKTMAELVNKLVMNVSAPLCLDSSSPEVLETALRIYPGRALINSISNEKAKIEKLLPVAAKYGAMFILLPLDDGGVPETAEERKKIVSSVYSRAAEYGFRKEDIVIDGLVMTVSANQEAAKETLKVIEWSKNEFGCPTIIGLSNVSFGLPERKWINSAFGAMAIERGLTMAIADPSDEILMNIKAASDVLCARDKNGEKYIQRFASLKQESDISNGTGFVAKDSGFPAAVGDGRDNPGENAGDNAAGYGATAENGAGKNPGESTDVPVAAPGRKIYKAVLKGSVSEIKSLIEDALRNGLDPEEIVNSCLVPAINEVGDLYNEKKYFLPQLINCAETMRLGFETLEPLLLKKTGQSHYEGIIVLATVKGDIHDIGKNIVGLMLKNYGFKVHDIGKDCSAEFIISEAVRTGADIIGLSALMTTTMTEMPVVIKLAKKRGLKCRFMIGGAVVDENYAREIGADGYSRDAYEAVLLVKRLMDEIKSRN